MLVIITCTVPKCYASMMVLHLDQTKKNFALDICHLHNFYHDLELGFCTQCPSPLVGMEKVEIS